MSASTTVLSLVLPLFLSLGELLAYLPLATVPSPWGLLPPGVWLIFGVVGLPVYAVFLGWFLGKPRNLKTNVLGCTVFLALVTALWFGLFATTMVIRLVFF